MKRRIARAAINYLSAGLVTLLNCQCRMVQLSLEVYTFIDSKYHDCLCLNCLQNLKNKYNFFKEKYFLK